VARAGRGIMGGWSWVVLASGVGEEAMRVMMKGRWKADRTYAF
jgi:hypothetical protein